MVLSSTYDFDSSVRLIVAMLKGLHRLPYVANRVRTFLSLMGRCPTAVLTRPGQCP